MSLATFKNKSRRFKVPISAHGFSLNGGFRNVGAVGQTNLMRSRTSCGTNDSSVTKLSTKNNLGHIYSSLLYPTTCSNGAAPTIWVKNFSPDDRSQAFHIRHVANKVFNCNNNTHPSVPDAGMLPAGLTCQNAYIDGRLVPKTPYSKDLKKNISGSEYIRLGLMTKNDLPPPKGCEPFPPVFNHNGCNIDVINKAQASAARLI